MTKELGFGRSETVVVNVNCTGGGVFARGIIDIDWAREGPAKTFFDIAPQPSIPQASGANGTTGDVLPTFATFEQKKEATVSDEQVPLRQQSPNSGPQNGGFQDLANTNDAAGALPPTRSASRAQSEAADPPTTKAKGKQRAVEVAAPSATTDIVASSSATRPGTRLCTPGISSTTHKGITAEHSTSRHQEAELSPNLTVSLPATCRPP